MATVHVGLQLGKDDCGVSHAYSGGDGRQVYDKSGEKLRELKGIISSNLYKMS